MYIISNPLYIISNFLCFPEPLYQYLNHADFTTTPHMIRSNKVVTLPCKKESNQLEIARQLSINYRKLWCEQPEVTSHIYTCGILEVAKMNN